MGKLNWSRLEEYPLRQVHSNVLPARIVPYAAAGTIRHLSAVCFQTNSNGSNVKPSCLSHRKPEPARVSIRYLRSCAGDWWHTGVGRGTVQKTNFSSNTTGSYWCMPPISSPHTVPPSASNNSHSRLSYLFSFLHKQTKPYTLLQCTAHSQLAKRQGRSLSQVAYLEAAAFWFNSVLMRVDCKHCDVDSAESSVSKSGRSWATTHHIHHSLCQPGISPQSSLFQSATSCLFWRTTEANSWLL